MNRIKLINCTPRFILGLFLSALGSVAGIFIPLEIKVFVDSGKENGFKALVYLHRYNPDTIALLRINYLHKMQNAYENAISSMDAIIESEAPQGEKTKAMKQKERKSTRLNSSH